jgi:hypothetical protein
MLLPGVEYRPNDSHGERNQNEHKRHGGGDYKPEKTRSDESAYHHHQPNNTLSFHFLVYPLSIVGITSLFPQAGG